MPELIAQTNMDQQSVNRLREELSKFTIWLSKHTHKYFANQYVRANSEYIDKSKGAPNPLAV
jgi:mortality factor 4-like protein 1